MPLEQAVLVNESEEKTIHEDQSDESLVYDDEATLNSVWRFFSKWSLYAGALFGVKIRIHIINLLWLALIFFDNRDVYDFYPKEMICISVILALVLHELTHCLVARKLGYSVKGIVLILPLGALAFISLRSARPLARLAICLSGPLFNLLTVLAIYLLEIYFAGVIDYFQINSLLRTLLMISLAMGVFNLIPLFPLDGGNILRDTMLLCKANSRIADVTTLVTALACFIGLVFLSLEVGAVHILIVSVLLIIVAVLELGFGSRLSGKEEISKTLNGTEKTNDQEVLQ